MKVFKRLIIITMIPILLELSGFFFVDQFYLNTETVFNTKKVEATSKKPNKINVSISDKSENIGVSFSGNYISYYENKTITIVDTSNNKKNQINLDSNSTLSMYKWLPDRDIMLISYKYINSSGKGFIKFKSYNAKKNEAINLANDKNKEVNIPLNDSSSDVQNITLSTATNVTYIQVGKKGTLSKLFRINVMAQMENTRYPNCTLGNISVLNKEDKLIYEDTTHNRIRVLGITNPIATGENASHYLLGTDNDDKIYIGNGEENKVRKIFVATLNSVSQPKAIDLKAPTDKNNIYISKSGKIYINDNENSKVLDLETGKETAYKGTFIKIFDSGVIANNNGKLIGAYFVD